MTDSADTTVPAPAQTQAERLARLYLVLTRTNRSIAGASSERELLDAACETVVVVGGFRMSWAGVADPTEGDVRVVACAGADDGYLDLVQIRLAGERSEGPTGQAFRLQRTIVCDDVATDSRMGPWREAALARGYRSSIGLPLTKGGQPYGVLTVYADQPNRFDAGEVELLEELGRDVSFGLGALEEAAERRRAEAALAESEMRLATSLETLIDPFVLLRAVRDEGGRIVDFVYEFANDAACRANRVSRENLVGARLLELLPEHEAAGLLQAYARVVETGEPLVIDDLDYTDAWGGERLERVFDVRASKLGDGIAYTWRDVTERRTAERRRADELERRVRERTADLEAARERALALARFSTAVLSAASRVEIATMLLDVARSVSGAEDGLVALVAPDQRHRLVLASFGYSARATALFNTGWLQGRTPIGDAISSGGAVLIEDPDEFRRRYPEIAGLDERLASRARLGVAMRTEEHAIGGLNLGFERPRTFEDEELAFFVSLGNAAAHALERLRLTEAEREARGMLDAVVAQMPVGVTVVDAAGETLYRNAALDAVFGRSTGAPGAALRHGLRSDGRAYAENEWPVDRSLATGEVVVNEEVAVPQPGGSTAFLLQTSAPVRDPGGGIVGAVVVTIDVTARREAEQLRDAFLGVLSHELRTPVTTIYGGAKMLASRFDRLEPDVRQGLVNDVAAESDRLNRLVDDLLVLARAERGVDLTARGAALVQHRLRSVVRALRTEWPEREFVTIIPDAVPPVTGDESYIEQVLRNLLGNAAKYGRRHVEARVEVAEGTVRVTVLDDGPGIDSAEMESIFRLFSRGSATKMLPGAGIGLFVARRLVEAMGGELSVENRPEGGAAFSFWLPQFDEQPEGSSEASDGSPDAGASPDSGSSAEGSRSA